MIQLMAFSACGKTEYVTPMETDIVQTQQPENLEENITAEEETSCILIAYFSQPTAYFLNSNNLTPDCVSEILSGIEGFLRL